MQSCMVVLEDYALVRIAIVVKFAQNVAVKEARVAVKEEARVAEVAKVAGTARTVDTTARQTRNRA